MAGPAVTGLAEEKEEGAMVGEAAGAEAVGATAGALVEAVASAGAAGRHRRRTSCTAGTSNGGSARLGRWNYTNGHTGSRESRHGTPTCTRAGVVEVGSAAAAAVAAVAGVAADAEVAVVQTGLSG